eukprot:2484663-Ditylum_brightwellii.AAC.1
MESIIVKSQDGNGKGGLTLNTLRSLLLHAQNSEEGALPPDGDHQKHTNPYLSKYGERWKEKIKESKATPEAFEDTIHKDDFLFYHDALSLMTNKESLEWMREKNILKHWILPEEGLNS